LQTTDSYTVRIDKEGNLVGCTYVANPLEVYLLEVADGTTSVKKDAIPLVKKTVKLAGAIDSSLFAAFAGIEEMSNLVYAFADIFASKIDFNTELQKGDKFSLIVDKYYKGDKFIGYGKIQIARYTMTSGKVFAGHYFSTAAGVGSYFDKAGKEVGTSFLRSPVPMGRLTSGFTHRRKHPVTGRFQPHLGVDLAAPVGTPILAASDGTVISIGTNGANGRQIILSHDGAIKTYYGHLSRYKKGLKKGSSVNIKEVIGYVGSSGLATGPHLDYRLEKNGMFRNPFDLEFSPKSELAGAEQAKFQAETAALESILASLPDAPENIVQVRNFILGPDQKLALL
jgi:murein DD-endopeptidase MepM/ murein hydrolase activator NlpD